MLKQSTFPHLFITLLLFYNSFNALANEDTLLPTQMFARARSICCGHKFCARDTKNVSDFVEKHFVPSTNVSQFAQHGNTTFILGMETQHFIFCFLCMETSGVLNDQIFKKALFRFRTTNWYPLSVFWLIINFPEKKKSRSSEPARQSPKDPFCQPANSLKTFIPARNIFCHWFLPAM